MLMIAYEMDEEFASNQFYVEAQSIGKYRRLSQLYQVGDLPTTNVLRTQLTAIMSYSNLSM